MLTSCYDLTREQVSQALETPRRPREIVLDRAQRLSQALRIAGASGANFSDCLIERTAAAAGCEKTLTFETRAASIAGGMSLHYPRADREPRARASVGSPTAPIKRGKVAAEVICEGRVRERTGTTRKPDRRLLYGRSIPRAPLPGGSIPLAPPAGRSYPGVGSLGASPLPSGASGFGKRGRTVHRQQPTEGPGRRPF